MKVAVLGAAGFLGSYICKNLHGHEVIPVSRRDLDLRDHSAVQRWISDVSPQVIINCATAGGKDRMADCNYADLQNNLDIFLNFYNLRHLGFRFINVGSGAEFDKSRDINRADESTLLISRPKDSYSYSKNVIARMILDIPDFYTLRLFGCFDSSEADLRLLKRCLLQQEISIRDCEFDLFSASDFLKVLDHYILETSPRFQDINCVYADKTSLKTIVTRFASIHNRTLKITLGEQQPNYTGSGEKLASLGLDLSGLDRGLEKYACKEPVSSMLPAA